MYAVQAHFGTVHASPSRCSLRGCPQVTQRCRPPSAVRVEESLSLNAALRRSRGDEPALLAGVLLCPLFGALLLQILGGRLLGVPATFVLVPHQCLQIGRQRWQPRASSHDSRFRGALCADRCCRPGELSCSVAVALPFRVRTRLVHGWILFVAEGREIRRDRVLVGYTRAGLGGSPDSSWEPRLFSEARSSMTCSNEGW